MTNDGHYFIIIIILTNGCALLLQMVQLNEVNPSIGPKSGGTRLYLTGTNLNIGSSDEIYLDDLPCRFDRYESYSNSCFSLN